MILQVAVQDIGQLTDFERWPASPSRHLHELYLVTALTAAAGPRLAGTDRRGQPAGAAEYTRSLPTPAE
jgi:hypothetical protein